MDARYEQFFVAAQAELQARDLTLPTIEGTFGICWEEWAAHLAAFTVDFREAERLLRLAEAQYTLDVIAGCAVDADAVAIRRGFDALLRYAEHDFGGTDRARAAISAGVRAAAATEALAIGRALAPAEASVVSVKLNASETEAFTFDWRGGHVRFDPLLGAVTSLTGADGAERVPQRCGIALGEFV